jgi:hypothetical protein
MYFNAPSATADEVHLLLSILETALFPTTASCIGCAAALYPVR